MTAEEELKALCASACAGNQSAFASLEITLGHRLQQSLRGWLQGARFQQDREDLLQATLLGVFQRVCELARLVSDIDILHYCRRIARRRWIDWLQAQRQQLQIERSVEPTDLVVVDDERRHHQDWLETLLLRLAPQEQQVLQQRLEERSRREIAERLQLSDGVVSRLYQRIKQVAVEFAASDAPEVSSTEGRDHVDA